MNTVKFTVAIPTYNGEHRLPEVLERLRSQINIEHLPIEVIVIDNNSKDGTARVVQTYQANFPYPLRYVSELRQGAAFARKRAIVEARSELIGFLDDDNLPAPNWVAAAYQFAETHPLAGAFGSRIHGDFEVEPPQELQRLIPFLAITERGPKPLRYEPSKKVLPPSAGLVVRKKAWLSSVPRHTILSGRVEGSMLTGEDLEAIAHIQQAGWEIWYNAHMEITHKIPRWRLEEAYLLPFFRGIGLGRYVSRMMSVKRWQRPWMLIAYSLNDLRKIIMHLLKYRNRVRTDLAAACEMQLFVCSLISPFYLYNKGYFRKPHTHRSESSDIAIPNGL
ncbi:glycosyltransferase family 2 protein [Oscillatoria sp. FACHB-1407]|nr:hormogonium polysaccharide biosynthesis glycosyltransferase HpsE [Oscillatoria sp. FACHB-1407]MBD2464444.1 glycosyltransferase family 2 protein [Oscillatoria sp. FACHB-1407]